MPNCEHIARHRYCLERTKNEWDNAAKTYVKQGLWNYSFIHEASVSDCEQSFLSRFVFVKLMKSKTDDIPANGILIKVDDVIYHFDLMNNFDDEGFKHTIGNFAPIPADKFQYQTTEKKYHLQMIHKWKNERWDRLLKYLKDSWPYEKPSFAEYIKSTHQHLYVKSIFNKFYDEQIVFDEIDWKEKVSNWDEEILNEEKLELISFDNFKEPHKVMKFLIEARGRCILGCLGNKNYTP